MIEVSLGGASSLLRRKIVRFGRISKQMHVTEKCAVVLQTL